MFRVDKEKCIGCQQCLDSCPVNAISMIDTKAEINEDLCQECGSCARVCPVDAIYNDADNNTFSGNNFSIDQRGARSGGSFSGRGLGQGRGKGLGKGPRDGRGSGRGGGGRNR